MTRLLMVEACVAALAARLALRLLPWRDAARVVRAVRCLPRVAASESECRRAAAAAAAAVAHPTCLYRALIEYALLGRRYDAVRLHLGTSSHAGFASHAWITIDGRPLDPEAARYAPLWTAPPLGGA